MVKISLKGAILGGTLAKPVIIPNKPHWHLSSIVLGMSLALCLQTANFVKIVFEALEEKVWKVMIIMFLDVLKLIHTTHLPSICVFAANITSHPYFQIFFVGWSNLGLLKEIILSMKNRYCLDIWLFEGYQLWNDLALRWKSVAGTTDSHDVQQTRRLLMRNLDLGSAKRE